MPSSAAGSGTPITGSKLCAATTPGRAADRPAIAITTPNPFFFRLRRKFGRAFGMPVRRGNLDDTLNCKGLKLGEAFFGILQIRLRTGHDENFGGSHLISFQGLKNPETDVPAIGHAFKLQRLYQIVRGLQGCF